MTEYMLKQDTLRILAGIRSIGQAPRHDQQKKHLIDELDRAEAYVRNFAGKVEVGRAGMLKRLAIWISQR